MKEWQQLQKKLYRQTKQDIRLLIQRKPKALVRYEKEFIDDQKGFKACSQRALIRAINQANTTFIGDFHTLRQSQRLVLRFLRDKEIRRPKFLAFEILKKSQMKPLNAWLKTKSEKAERKFRNIIQLETTWGAHWETFKDVFLWCHDHKIQIISLGCHFKTLRQQDRHAAKVINSLAGKTWVLFGEFHCARPHIPRLLSQLSSEKKIVVIQQNDDKASLKELGSLTTKKSILLQAPSSKKHSIDLFCILHTPLWLKWRSYLERHLKAPEVLSPSESLIDPQHQISWSFKTLYEFLEDPRYPKRRDLKDLLDVNVFGPEDKWFARMDPSTKKLMMNQLRSSGVATLQQRRKIYLSEVTINSCAQAASSYIYKAWTCSSPSIKYFYQYALSECMAFFLSKILNHSRKAYHPNDFKELVKDHDTKREAQAVLQALKFSESFKAKKTIPSPQSPLRSRVAVAVGRMIADAAFEAFLSGEFSKQRFTRLMTHAPSSEFEAFETLIELKSVGAPFNSRKRTRW